MRKPVRPVSPLDGIGNMTASRGGCRQAPLGKSVAKTLPSSATTRGLRCPSINGQAAVASTGSVAGAAGARFRPEIPARHLLGPPSHATEIVTRIPPEVSDERIPGISRLAYPHSNADSSVGTKGGNVALPMKVPFG